MVPKPAALALTVCELVIVEQGSGRISTINAFNDFSASGFPYRPPRFFVFAMLTGAQGDGDVTLTLTQLATDQGVYLWMERFSFAARFHEVPVIVEPSFFEFPSPGVYTFALEVDGEDVAERRVYVS